MILSLIAEATECDFKSKLERKKSVSWLKSVSALANGIGGTLFFGVADDSSIVGLNDTQSDAEFISRSIKDALFRCLILSLRPTPMGIAKYWRS